MLMVETGISILEGAGGTQRLTRMIGQSRALDLLGEGRFISPAEAQAIGIVRHVGPRQERRQARRVDRQADSRCLADDACGRVGRSTSAGDP
jgi:enoyl-CoA hydratase/carnithine racemase